MNGYFVERSSYLSHHGILGQRWGVRRYQNADGSLTDRGKRRYGINDKNGITRVPSKKTNTNKRGISQAGDPFSEVTNKRVINQLLKDTNNCTLCTYAMDLRKRGIDVRAGGSNERNDGMTTEQIERWYKGNNHFTNNNNFYFKINHDGTFLTDNFDKAKSDNEIKQGLLAGGEGSYGHLILQNVVNKEFAVESGMESQFLGGHDVFYQIENGEVYIIDAQSADKYTYDEFVNLEYADGLVMLYPTDFMRTDNLEPAIDVDENGKLIYSPKELVDYDITTDIFNPKPIYTNIVEPMQTPTSNYSPPTSTIKTKPSQYNPPYKSKSEMELFVEDCANFVKKEAAWERKVISKVGEGIENFVNTLDSLLWRLY